jgi:hypothetical protein
VSPYAATVWFGWSSARPYIVLEKQIFSKPLRYTHESATSVCSQPDESNLHVKIFFIRDNFFNNSNNKF